MSKYPVNLKYIYIQHYSYVIEMKITDICGKLWHGFYYLKKAII